MSVSTSSMVANGDGALAFGAGSLVKVPLNRLSGDEEEKEASEDELQPAYLVSPAAHAGRVVTGVVLLPPPVSTQKSIDQSGFSATTIAFADRLAEQGYKVLVVMTASTQATDQGKEESVVLHATTYLKQQQDIQRLAVFGVSAGADLAMQLAIEQGTDLCDCVILMCPEGNRKWKVKAQGCSFPPTLLLSGDGNPFLQSQVYLDLQEAYKESKETDGVSSEDRLRVKQYEHQGPGFAFDYITDEDAATQAIAEALDWLMAHLHRFALAAGTSDHSPWWPQGKNGPFLNIGARTWQSARDAWLTPVQAKPPHPPPVPSHVLFEGLSSVRRTFELPQAMRLGDIVELFVEIWDVQQ